MRVEPLSRIYRARFREAMRAAGVYGRIPPVVRTKGWNADARPVGSGEHAVRCVGRCVFRVAISNSRIAGCNDSCNDGCDDHRVVFTYADDEGRTRSCSLDAIEFIRRFLQHVLPRGFVKVRHFGFLNHNSRHSVEEIRAKVADATGAKIEGTADRDEAAAPTYAVPPCPKCGRPMRLVAVNRLPLRNTG